MMQHCVRILKQRSLSPKEFRNIAEELGVLDTLCQARIIGIKPNLAAGSYCAQDSGVLVATAMLEQVIQGLRAVNPEAAIWIMESDSTAGGYAYLKFEHLELHELAARHPGVSLKDLSRDRLRRVQLDGYHFESVDVAESLFACDVLLSVAKIKTHNMTGVTGATKNLFGCLPASDKSVYHTAIDKVVADMARLLPVTLCVLDGNPGMEGNGPVNGVTMSMDRILLGDNPIATDAVMAAMIGMEPGRVRHLSLAQAAGVGSANLADIRLLGATLKEASVCVRRISAVQQAIISGGIRIQRVGEAVAHFGHLVHFQNGVLGVLKICLKVVLMPFLGKKRISALKEALLCVVPGTRKQR